MHVSMRKSLASGLAAVMLLSSAVTGGGFALTGAAAPGSEGMPYLKGDVSATVYVNSIAGSPAASNEQEKSMLFDHRNATKFATAAVPAADAPVTVSFKLFYAEAIATYALGSAEDAPGRDPKAWTLYGRNEDGESWTAIDSRAGQVFENRSEVKTYPVADPVAYSQYKLDITENNGAADGTQLAELQIATGQDVDLHLTWPEGAWNEGTPQAWAVNASEQEKAATLEAFNTAYNRLLDAGYNIGRGKYGGGPSILGAWSNYANVQCEGDFNDNPGSPFQPGRNWGILAAARPGVVFAVKGIIAATCSPSLIAYGNDLAWTDPATGKTNLYQVFSGDTTVKKDLDGKDDGWPGYGVGTGAPSRDKAVMEEVYIQSGWYNDSFGRPYNLGFPAGRAQTEDGISFQEFFGNDSSGASPEADRDGDYGISYLAASEAGHGAFLITDKMMTAWSKTWTTADDGGVSRFSVTGAPISNQKTDKDGNIEQAFQNVVIRIDGETGETQVLQRRGEFISFEMPDGVVVKVQKAEDLDLLFIVEDGPDLTKLAPTYTLNEGAVCDVPSGTVRDFSEPVEYKITSESGAEYVYTIGVLPASLIPEEDWAVAEKVNQIIAALPETVYLNHAEQVRGAADAYDSLSEDQQLLVENPEKLDAAVARIEAMDQPIRVTCVGDSITEGVGAGAGESYPDQMQALLGDGYSVFNAGVSATNIIDGKGTTFPYWTTSKYNEGKAFLPDIALIMMGTNDATNRNWVESGIENVREVFKEDYRKLINEYKALSSDPYIFIVLPMTCYGGGNQDRMTNLENSIIPALRELAEEENVGLIDMHSFTAGHADWFPDTLHPNKDSYGYVADEFAQYVSGYAQQALKDDLKDLELDGETIADFHPDSFSYTVELEADAKIPAVTASAAFEGAEVEIAASEDGMTHTVTVTSADGRYQQVYTVSFQRKQDVIIPGDLNGDGNVNVTDVMEACRVLARKVNHQIPTDDEMARGDVNQDGYFTITDVMGICKMIAATVK